MYQQLRPRIYEKNAYSLVFPYQPKAKLPKKCKKDPKTDVFESSSMVREAGLEPARPE